LMQSIVTFHHLKTIAFTFQQLIFFLEYLT